MNVLQCLTELYNSQDIDSVYRKLALKILGNLDQMKRVTIYDIAELTNSSRTTVWRLVQKLGYDSFSDFRYALQSAASQYTYYNRMVEQRKSVSGEKLVSEIAGQLTEVRKMVEEQFSAEEIDELVDEIERRGIDITRFCRYILITTVTRESSLTGFSSVEAAKGVMMEELYAKLKENGIKQEDKGVYSVGENVLSAHITLDHASYDWKIVDMLHSDSVR